MCSYIVSSASVDLDSVGIVLSRGFIQIFGTMLITRPGLSNSSAVAMVSIQAFLDVPSTNEG